MGRCLTAQPTVEGYLSPKRLLIIHIMLLLYLRVLYKSSCFPRGVLSFSSLFAKTEDQPPAGFPNKKQAGIELLPSFLETLKEIASRSFVLLLSQKGLL